MRKKFRIISLLCAALVLALGGMGMAEGVSSVSRMGDKADSIVERDEKDIPQAIADFVAKYPEAQPFADNFEKESRLRHYMDVSAEMEEREIPLFIQWDARWGYENYGGNYLGVNGCGPTCLAMVLCGLTDDEQWNPYEVAKYSKKRGYYTRGSGTAWALMTEGAKSLGLGVTSGVASSEYILDNLSEETPIICSVRPGDFTLGGHYIVLTGIDENGEILLNDPNSPERSDMSWEVERLVPQIKALWRYSVEPISDQVMETQTSVEKTEPQATETPANGDDREIVVSSTAEPEQTADVVVSGSLYDENDQISQQPDDGELAESP